VKKICIFGDSHVAAFRAGWALIQNDFPDTELSFFAAGGTAMKEIVVANGCLVAEDARLKGFWETTSGGRARVEPVFDHYILYGLGLKIMSAIKLYMSAFRENRALYRKQPVEDEKLAKSFSTMIEETLLFETLSKLRQISEAPALLIAAPFPAASAEPKWVERVRRTKQEERIVEAFRDQCARFAEKRSAAFLAQPKETLSEFCLMTQSEFCAGRPFLMSEYQGEDDSSHMNSAYGAIVLRAALDLIG
jgi:hypothetical protein